MEGLGTCRRNPCQLGGAYLFCEAVICIPAVKSCKCRRPFPKFVCPITCYDMTILSHLCCCCGSTEQPPIAAVVDSCPDNERTTFVLTILSHMSLLDRFRQGAHKAGLQATAFAQTSANKIVNESKGIANSFSLPGEAEKAANILESFLGWCNPLHLD